MKKDPSLKSLRKKMNPLKKGCNYIIQQLEPCKIRELCRPYQVLTGWIFNEFQI